MTYAEILAHIYGRGRFGVKPGLERIREILSLLGNPQERLRTVQIAGTNGKGSTGSFLAAIMSAAGYRTAFFSSPHLSNFSERFRIDGAEAAEDDVAAVARRVLAVAPGDATFFEIVTAMGFLLFADQEVDLAIMEAGMGGRWDATNVANGLLAVITPISYDHCEYLGKTLAEIAAEKAGIIRQGRPVVVAPQEPEALETIRRAADMYGAPCHLWGEHFSCKPGGGGLIYQAGEYLLEGLLPGLRGRFQSVNMACAITAARLLGEPEFIVDDGALRSGVAAARWPGRMELFPGPPRILLDGAHNPAGAAALADSLADVDYRQLLLVFGVMADKAWQELLGPLLPLASRVIAVEPALERALPAETLAGFCRQRGVDAAIGGTVRHGMELAGRLAGEGDLLLVCGSLFTVGEARSILTGRDFMPIRG
ncbi:MAG TPA: folylpolyglutamate synthase/dihydrofolate synthase family protein [Geobacteraceae bacterium]|nr:folylpolyglutamate synthase/dihydrofolate synthase family protein [Geobacteraceae bacterium]